MNKDERDQFIHEILRKEHFSFADLCGITALLRGEGGCPWDREQTHESIRRCMIEEAYEVVEAIDKRDAELLCEELGDVLFQVVFHAQLEREEGNFDANNVIDGICRKMIHRHPHVFGTSAACDSKDALSQWEAIKTEEKQRKTLSSRLRAIPPILPALLRAQKVHEKLGASEADQETLGNSIQEQAQKLSEKPTEDRMGELLFAIAKLSAGEGFDAEKALSQRIEQAILDAEALKK